ncbi:hypothetical protein [Desulfuromonas thiophila]|uniref:Uncharacterized protein n=1 Tax=Desulfuromonas thiophila TaxID=57664 RepID=A0A1G6XU36_9BACT|nr:hypothetical protein [Desulfuromonas thiophila]SDD81491.1 hypothetical protein SAMN05661003_101392 [Desulfuromonas thiophila]
MKITLLKDFEAKTTEGPRLLPAGRELDLAEEKARALIAAGIAEPADLPRPYLDRAGELVIPLNCPARFKWWAGGQSALDTLRELFEERAAIMEFDGGLPRDEAERRAAEITGYHPQPRKTKDTDP